MVDSTKKLTKHGQEKTLDPLQIYEKLDRKSDKGPLRPSQIAVLRRWHDHLRGRKDVVLKMHTGQGKTLAGLLMLQSKLNEFGKPVLYLCPNEFLVEQTVAQGIWSEVRYRSGRSPCRAHGLQVSLCSVLFELPRELRKRKTSCGSPLLLLSSSVARIPQSRRDA